MIKNYQEMQRISGAVVPTPMYGTIVSTSNGRAVIQFSDGSTGQKTYKLTPGISFSASQRVQLSKQSGTFIVTNRI